MTGTPHYLALDVGAVTTRIAVGGTRSRLVSGDTPRGSVRDNVLAALRMAPRPADEICVVLPDTWFSGSVPEARRLEEVREACEGEPIVWAGQLAAVAAWHGRNRAPGRYLVCDIGYGGVRVGSFLVTGATDGTGGTVRTETVLSQDGGGRDFDQAVRAVAGGDALPGDWHDQAKAQGEWATQIFQNAATSPDHADDRAYKLEGRPAPVRLTARQLMACFAPARERLAAGVSAALGAGPPDTVVLAGGLAWFPLAVLAVRDLVEPDPVVGDASDAARGALLFARGEMSPALPAGLETVSLPMNRVRGGSLEQESLKLSWTEPFASPPEGMPPLDREELVLEVSGRYRTVRLPGLVPGPHRIGLRPGWSGPGVLVVRPASGGRAHVVSLDPAIAP
jgi:hypothetical protein